MRLLKIALFLLSLVASLHGEPAVAVLDSQSVDTSVTAGGRVVATGEAFNPVGAEIRTGTKDFAALVFSNGVALYVAPDSKLSIKAYDQSPFKSRPDDFEYEPSRSSLQASLDSGLIGVAQREPNPVSEFTITMEEGETVSLKAQYAALIRDNLGSITAILDGRGSIQINDINHLVNEGYRFQKTKTSAPDEQLRPLSESERKEWTPYAELANIALRRWYFQTTDDGVVMPIRIAPPAINSSKGYNNTKL